MLFFYHELFAGSFFVMVLFVWTSWLASPRGKLLLSSAKIVLAARVLVIATPLLSYVVPGLSLSLSTAFLLISVNNVHLILWTEALGEDAFRQLAMKIALAPKFGKGLLITLAPGLIYTLLATALLVFSPSENFGVYWIACGIAYYAFGLSVKQTIAFIRFRRSGFDSKV